MTSCAFWVSSERSLCAALRAYVRVMRTTWISPVFLCLLATAPVAGQGRAEPNLRPGLQIVAQEERYVVEVYNRGQQVRVYTRWFVERALRGGRRLQPLEWGCAKPIRGS